MNMNTLWAGAALAGFALMTPSVSLASIGTGFDTLTPTVLSGPMVSDDDGSYEEARRGRGRGRGGDRDRDDDRSDRSDDRRNDRSDDRRDDRRNDSSSGRDRPRIPGGSGCDDPGDIAEHPECRGGATGGSGAATGGNNSGGNGHGGRPRIPGGSGCDDPGDIIEHPECRI